MDIEYGMGCTSVMPFTPFHMGPGLALKAVSGRYFSVLVFGIAQVAMDIEPLIGIVRGSEILHGRTHSYVGATMIGLLVMFLAPPLCRLILSAWNDDLEHRGLSWLRSGDGIGRLSAATGAFFGTYSHVALDSMMHWDVDPYWPWSTSNPLRGLISVNSLYILCVVMGFAGILVWFVQGWRRKDKRRQGVLKDL
jgi:hypothetical protein